jgi:uncharacterized protein
MKIAIVGSGITGMAAAWALKDVHDVTLFEKEDRLGGHSNTLRIDHNGKTIDVDTGFIVYNSLNYPNLIAFFEALQVETKPSDMSFSVRDGRVGGEWGSDGPRGFFAWKRNLFDPAHWKLLADMLSFNKQAQIDANSVDLTAITLGDYCRQLGVSQAFLDRYLVPMGAAIWSTPEAQMLDYPAASFVRFFNNHRLLHIERPMWRTVEGGSIRYVTKVAEALGDRVRLNSAVTAAARTPHGVMVNVEGHAPERFDQIIFACHSSQTLQILSDADADETALLGAVRFGANVAVLHRDEPLMPRRKAAWASWNVDKNGPNSPITLNYWMNRLQGIDPSRPVFVTLNPAQEPDSAKTFARIEYEHPLFDQAASAAQRLFPKIQGINRAWFAGAWQGYGFHEDGLRAGLRVALRLGGHVPWTFEDDDIPRADWGVPMSEATPAQAVAGF